jgi:putative DNA primase/helicase
MGWARENLDLGLRKAIAEGLIAQGGGKVTQHSEGEAELIGRCPMHQDENPSFSYNYAKDVFNCSSQCGGGDLVKLYAGVNGLDNKTGFKQFKEKYGADTGPGGKSRSGAKPGRAQGRKEEPEPAPVIPEAVWDALEPLPMDWLNKLKRGRGWTREAVEKLNLRFWRAPEGPDRDAAMAQKLYVGQPGERRIAIPVRDEMGKLRNIRLYRPGADTSKVVSWGRGYGCARLWPLQLNEPVYADQILWLCEGEPDVICAVSQGLEAVTVTTGAGTWRPGFNARFAGRDVAIAYDADQAGWKGALKVAKHLTGVAGRVRVLRWPDFMMPEDAQNG